MAEEELTKIGVRLDWHVPEDIITRYANNLVVQHHEHEFILYFFEFLPPLIFGSPEEQLAQLKTINSVRANCVARIVVDADDLEGFIGVLQDNLQKHHMRTQSSSQSSEDIT
jgi:hypothetical protein